MPQRNPVDIAYASFRARLQKLIKMHPRNSLIQSMPEERLLEYREFSVTVSDSRGHLLAICDEAARTLRKGSAESQALWLFVALLDRHPFKPRISPPLDTSEDAHALNEIESAWQNTFFAVRACDSYRLENGQGQSERLNVKHSENLGVRYTALGELLDLPLPERMQLIEREPTKLLGVRDEWMEIAKFEAYDEEVGSWGGCWNIKKKIDYRLLTETIVAWADIKNLADCSPKLNEYFFCVMAAYEPGAPWGEPRKQDELSKVWRDAWSALERVTNQVKIEIVNRSAAAVESSQQAVPNKILSPLAQDILLAHYREDTNEYNLLPVKPAQGSQGLLDILVNMGRSSDEKEVNKATRELKERGFYLSKSGPRGGGYVTDSGRLEAKRIESSR